MDFHNILNSIDISLEKNNPNYSNSFVDSLMDNLISYLSKSNNFSNFENLSPNTLFSLDRFEGNYAVCENMDTGEMLDIPRSKINFDAKEGDILRFKDNFFELDFEATKNAKEDILDLLEKNKNLPS